MQPSLVKKKQKGKKRNSTERRLFVRVCRYRHGTRKWPWMLLMRCIGQITVNLGVGPPIGGSFGLASLVDMELSSSNN